MRVFCVAVAAVIISGTAQAESVSSEDFDVVLAFDECVMTVADDDGRVRSVNSTAYMGLCTFGRVGQDSTLPCHYTDPSNPSDATAYFEETYFLDRRSKTGGAGRTRKGSALLIFAMTADGLAGMSNATWMLIDKTKSGMSVVGSRVCGGKAYSVKALQRAERKQRSR